MLSCLAVRALPAEQVVGHVDRQSAEQIGRQAVRELLRHERRQAQLGALEVPGESRRVDRQQRGRLLLATHGARAAERVTCGRPEPGRRRQSLDGYVW